MNKYCPKCEQEKPLEMFYTRRGNQTYSYCKPCVNNQTILRQRALKEKAVQYKGGRCADCEGVYHNACYDFHHENPEEKDFTFSKVKTTSWNEVLKQELDKCVLLCANCHRLRHTKY